MGQYLVLTVTAKLGDRVLYSFKTKKSLPGPFNIPFPPPIPPFKMTWKPPIDFDLGSFKLSPFGPYTFSKNFKLPPKPQKPSKPTFKIAGIPYPPPKPPFKFSWKPPKGFKISPFKLTPFGPYTFSKNFKLPPIPPIPPIPPFKIAGIPFPPPIPPIKSLFKKPTIPGWPSWKLSPFGFLPFATTKGLEIPTLTVKVTVE